MSLILSGLIYFIQLLAVLVSVAFITLVEQKILGSMQIRLGPNKSGYWGLLQPFADAVKLFTKEMIFGLSFNLSVYLLAPWLSLTLTLMLWSLVPLWGGALEWSLGVFFFICVSSLAVFPIFGMAWASNCKYSMLGGLRAVAQMVSYEVSLAMILLSLVWVSASFDFSLIYLKQTNVWSFTWGFPLCIIWLASSLAEMHRTPYDFSEGESELVSGFNTEYSSGGFTLIFMAEYASIIFMATMTNLLFFGNWIFPMKSIILVMGYIWVRGSYPRFRYDKLMSLAWKSFLPSTINMFIFYILVSALMT